MYGHLSYRGLYGVAGKGVDDWVVEELMLVSAKKLGGKPLKIDEYVRCRSTRVTGDGRMQRANDIGIVNSFH